MRRDSLIPGVNNAMYFSVVVFLFSVQATCDCVYCIKTGKVSLCNVVQMFLSHKRTSIFWRDALFLFARAQRRPQKEGPFFDPESGPQKMKADSRPSIFVAQFFVQNVDPIFCTSSGCLLSSDLWPPVGGAYGRASNEEPQRQVHQPWADVRLNVSSHLCSRRLASPVKQLTHCREQSSFGLALRGPALEVLRAGSCVGLLFLQLF